MLRERFLLCRLSVVNYRPHALEVLPSQVGKGQRTGRAAEQGRAKALLEELELPANRRLWHRQRSAGSTERTTFHDRDEQRHTCQVNKCFHGLSLQTSQSMF